MTDCVFYDFLRPFPIGLFKRLRKTIVSLLRDNATEQRSAGCLVAGAFSAHKTLQHRVKIILIIFSKHLILLFFLPS